ncbi:MAG: OstA-like protein [Ignavibacteriaceae bacterium]
MVRSFFIVIYFLISCVCLYSQGEDEKIIVIGDSLLGKVVSGESIREVIGNVRLKQGNVFVTCDKAIQYLARNEAELIGNVIAKEDSLTLQTEKGYYFGNLKKTKSTSGIILDDTKVVLSADSGVYFFNEARAFFQTNVNLIDSTTKLFADELTYFKDLDKSIAVRNVRINDGNNIITADTLTHFRKSKYSIADGNVSLKNIKDNITIYGSHLEDNGELKYTLINKNPLLIQIDTTFSTSEDSLEEISIDTLFIKSKVMEGFRSETNIFKATDSVKILRGNFASINDLTTYYRDDEKIITDKIKEDAPRPKLWYENSQLTGDSITIFLEDGQITELAVNENSFMLSQNKNYNERFDQTSSDSIYLFFTTNRLRQADFSGKVQSIYYLFDEEEPNGLVKSTAQKTVIIFENNEVGQVRLYGSPTSEYHPEGKVAGLERTFTLPKFVFSENRPDKEEFLMNEQKKDEQYIKK